MSWTDDRIALLKKLWAEGRTAAEIAKAIGGEITRNAVIGKAHRLKLASRSSPITETERAAPAKVKKPANTQKVPAPRVRAMPAAPVHINVKGIKMVDLKERMCRFPLGDPKDPDFKFCGCTSAPGLPYCADHARIAYQMNKRSKLMGVDETGPDEADDDLIKAVLKRV